MSAIFTPRSNLVAKLIVLGLLAVPAMGVAWWWIWPRTDFVRHTDWVVGQTVPFSHQHHVAGLGIDCRYCHASVEVSASAGMPTTDTCMTCHSQIWVGSPMLEPVRSSYRDDKSIQWSRVNAVPDFVYFNHSIHIAKGVGCTTCHGPMGDMPLTWRANSLLMGWCLDCHRAPENFVRPRDQVFNVNYQPPSNQHDMGRILVKDYKIKSLTNCTTCHR